MYMSTQFSTPQEWEEWRTSPRAHAQLRQYGECYVSIQTEAIRRLADSPLFRGNMEHATEFYVQGGFAELFHKAWEELCSEGIIPNSRHTEGLLKKIGLS